MKVSEKRREHIKPLSSIFRKTYFDFTETRIGTYDSFYKQLIETKVA